MKILYLTPRINDEGGVARVLAIKTNYLIEKWGYEIAIGTQNKGNTNLFFDFNSNIQLFDVDLPSNNFLVLFHYKKQIQKWIQSFQPDVIVVCDNGLKGFLFPVLFSTSIPIVFEVHGSKYNEELGYASNWVSDFFHNFKYKIRNFGAKKFDYFVALSKESAAEWNNVIAKIIPNPLVFTSEIQSTNESKTVIFVGRHSFEKGIDRLLTIWEIVHRNHPDWTLEIYGKSDSAKTYQSLAQRIKIDSSIRFFEPVSDIQNKYVNASIFVMTSRCEGFPMAILEAMSCRLPVVAFDCPIGPRSIITNYKDGFLIEDGNTESFAFRLNELIANELLRKKLGIQAKNNIQKFRLEVVMNEWNQLFTSVKNKL